ncbi:MAG: DMT family transporter [Mycoplasma sp.]|nr:DMT family transporter [Mycoplasma sp.]
MKNKLIALVSAVFWGFDPVLTSESSNAIKTNKNSTFLFSFLKEILCLIFTLILFNKKINFKQISKRDKVLLSIGGIFGGGISLSFYVTSMNIIGFGLSDLFISMYPLFVLFTSRLLFKERLSFLSFVGIILILSGSITVGIDVTTNGQYYGIIFAILGAISYGIEIVCVKFVKSETNVGTMLTLKYSGSVLALSMILVVLIFIPDFISWKNILSISLKIEVLFILLASANALASYIFYYIALWRTKTPSIIVAINSSYVLVAMIISWSLNDSAFNVYNVTGTILISLGLAVINIPVKNKSKNKKFVKGII